MKSIYLVAGLTLAFGTCLGHKPSENEMSRALLLIFTKPSTEVRWYGPEYDGRKTANGEIFSHRDLTFASKSLPFGTKVKVEYGGKSVIVRCNDRGPGHIELTKGAFAQLADPSVGVLKVTYTIQ